MDQERASSVKGTPDPAYSADHLRQCVHLTLPMLLFQKAAAGAILEEAVAVKLFLPLHLSNLRLACPVQMLIKRFPLTKISIKQVMN